jgi:hypothetical protein
MVSKSLICKVSSNNPFTHRILPMLASFVLNGATFFLYMQSNCREKRVDVTAFIVYWVLAAV